MNTPKLHNTAAVVRTRLTQIRASLSKLPSALQATAKHFIPATTAERTEQLRGRLAPSYRLINADDILVYLKSHKYLLPLLDVIPGKIRTVLAAEPETIQRIDLSYFQDIEEGDEHLTIIVNTNIDNVERKFEIRDILFASVLEPLYDQADGNITIRVQFP
ncbi:MAG: hypothetical protein K0U66_10360 [Gammaproteobacteria bacterium]|nr:hypothetical protein [Gammaproteobacteria bacterium]